MDLALDIINMMVDDDNDGGAVEDDARPRRRVKNEIYTCRYVKVKIMRTRIYFLLCSLNSTRPSEDPPPFISKLKKVFILADAV